MNFNTDDLIYSEVRAVLTSIMNNICEEDVINSTFTNANDNSKNDNTFRNNLKTIESSTIILRSDLVSLKKLLVEKTSEIESVASSSIESIRTIASHEISRLERQIEMIQLERKRMHDQIQESKGNIRIICRVRPAFETNSSVVIKCRKGKESLTVDIPSKGIDKTGNPRQSEIKIHNFDAVLGPESTQENVFDEVSGLIKSVIDGFHVLILAYGQTGSGKTHTMIGNNASPGLSPRALQYLFQLKQEMELFGCYKIGMKASMVEIYNDKIIDLLKSDHLKTSSSSSISESKIDIREYPTGNMLHGATYLPVSTISDIQRICEDGVINRTQCTTRSNSQSSRSHSVLSIDVSVTQIIKSNDPTAVLDHTVDTSMSFGRLSLVDLAGSERVSKSGVTGAELKEAQHINKSLSALGDVVRALSERQRQQKTSKKNLSDDTSTSTNETNGGHHIPSRNSTLTHLLSSSFKPGNKVVFFIHVAPEEEHTRESCNTLEFGSRAKGIDLGKVQ